MTHFSYRHLQLQILFALTQNTVLALEECVEVISLIHWMTTISEYWIDIVVQKKNYSNEIMFFRLCFNFNMFFIHVSRINVMTYPKSIQVHNLRIVLIRPPLRFIPPINLVGKTSAIRRTQIQYSSQKMFLIQKQNNNNLNKTKLFLAAVTKYLDLCTS